MNAPIRYTPSNASMNKIRLRKSGTLKMFLMLSITVVLPSPVPCLFGGMPIRIHSIDGHGPQRISSHDIFTRLPHDARKFQVLLFCRGWTDGTPLALLFQETA